MTHLVLLVRKLRSRGERICEFLQRCHLRTLKPQKNPISLKWFGIEVLALALLVQSGAAIPVFVAAASTPADNGTNPGPTVTIAPPASVQRGDLVVVFVQHRSSNRIITVEDASNGGQAWSFARQSNQTDVSARVFWCQFNGTWANNPVFTIDTDDRAAMSAIMLVFRPTTSAMFWMVDVFPVSTPFAAPQFPFTVTNTGITTVKPSTVSIAAWFDSTATTWGNLSGTGWGKAGLAPQYRNAAGSMSASFAYQIKENAGATNNVAQNQSAAQSGSSYMMSFAEVTLPVGGRGTTEFIQSASFSESAGATSNVLAFSRPVGHGHAVIGYSFFEVADPSDAGFLTPITDDKGNEYFPIQVVTDEFLAQTAVLFFCPNITNAPMTVTVRLSVQELFRGMVLHEVSGITALDKYSGTFHSAVDSSSPAVFSAPQVTPSVGNEYLFGAIHCTGVIPCGFGVPIFSALDNWTKRLETLGNNVNVASFDLIQSPASAISFRTRGTGDSNVDLLMATFRPVGVGSVTNTSLAAPQVAFAGTPIVLSATVTSPNGTPTGVVIFTEGEHSLGSAQLVDGTATLNLASLPAGTYSVIAAYNGDASFFQSTSSPTRVSVIPDFTVLANPRTLDAHQGQAVSTTITITPQPGGFDSAIQLSCSGTPSLSTCTLSPSSLVPGSSPATATLTITTVAATARLGTAGVSIVALCFSVVAIIITTAGSPHRRSRFQNRTIATILMLLGVVCCGGGRKSQQDTPPGTSKSGTPAGTYTIVVSASSGAIQHGSSVTLTVH